MRIETDEGLVGWGEVCDSYGCTYGTVVEATIRDAFAPLLIGEEVDAVEPLSARLRAWTMETRLLRRSQRPIMTFC